MKYLLTLLLSVIVVGCSNNPLTPTTDPLQKNGDESPTQIKTEIVYVSHVISGKFSEIDTLYEDGSWTIPIPMGTIGVIYFRSEGSTAWKTDDAHNDETVFTRHVLVNWNPGYIYINDPDKNLQSLYYKIILL